MFAGNSWWRVRRGRHPLPMRLVGPAVVFGLAAGILTASPMPAMAASAARPSTPTGHAVTGVKPSSKTHSNSQTMSLNGKSVGSYKPSGTQLPAASSGSATLSALGSSNALSQAQGSATAVGSMPKASISGTPLWAQRTSAVTGPGTVSAKVASQSVAKQLGVTGVVYSVAGSGGSGKVRVGLDYSSFNDAYGANFGSRLELYTLPACALTTPQLAKCRVRTPVTGAVNDSTTDTLSGVVQVAGSAVLDSGAAYSGGGSVSDGNYVLGSASKEAASSAGTDSTVLAASSGAGEEGAATGNYAASKISPAGSWTAGGSNGDFTYDYPITIPSASSPLTPKVELDYDSGSVDGKTSMTNAQASDVGDGWAAPADNYITQTFVPCADDPEGTAASNSTQDMCYDGELLTLSLNGSSTTIVDDGGTFKLQDDNGAVITHTTDSNKGQGTYNTDYWVITERNGTSYYFGMNELPGYASSDTATDSVDWEPVYSAHSGDPCYTSPDSVCDMAYEWHLDYVTDTHGDAMSYYYQQDTNYYGADNGASEKEYIRDSHLTEIDYGYTTASGAYGTIPDKVLFTTPTRCVAATCGTPSSSMSASTAASEYPDVPTDLICASGATCTSYSPSFFSTVLLSKITTEQYSPSASAYTDVDSYALTQDFPGTGDDSSGTLWLESITHTGDDTTASGGTGAAISEPSVSFSGTDLPNRWDVATYPGLYRWRISEVTSELGSQTSVTYEIPDACAASTSDAPTATPSSNTTSCFPVNWTRRVTPRRFWTGSSSTRSRR